MKWMKNGKKKGVKIKEKSMKIDPKMHHFEEI